MIYEERKCDVFEMHNEGYYLVHCISADFKLGAGIAKEFEKRFNLRDDLLSVFGDDWWKQFDNTWGGYAFLHSDKHIIDLITKQRFWHKPMIGCLIRALKKLRKGCEKAEITKIAMPKIGCGLDGLKWNEVSSHIKYIFKDSDIDICVCYL